MEIEKLFELLRLIGSVKSDKWAMVIKIWEAINNGTVKEKEKLWFEPFRNTKPEFYPINLTDLETWRTYDGDCIELIFENKDNLLICKATIWDGDTLHGYRRQKRFTAVLQLHRDFILQLEKRISYELDLFLENAYEDHLENQKRNWIYNEKTKMLNNIIPKSKKKFLNSIIWKSKD